MPRMSGIDPSSKAVAKTYFAPNSEMLVLQLWNEPPVYDKQGRMMEPAKDRKAYFDKGFYMTNREKEIEAIEASFAFKQGDIFDYKKFQVDETESQVDQLIGLAGKDPAMKRRLLAKLKEQGKKQEPIGDDTT